MRELLWEVVLYVPMAPWLLGIGVAGLILQTWLFVAASRHGAHGETRRDRTRLLSCIVVAAVLAFIVLAVLSIDRARALMLSIPADADGKTKMARVLASLSGQLNGIPLALGLFMLLTAWGAVALSVSWCARRRAAGLRFAAELEARGESAPAAVWRIKPGPSVGATLAAVMPVAGLGLLPCAATGCAYAVELIRALARSGSSPEEKIRLVDHVLVAWHDRFDAALAVTCVGLGVAVASASLILFLASPERARQRLLRAQGLAPVEPAIQSTWFRAIVAALLAAAIGLFLLARPLRAEALQAWPPVVGSSDVPTTRIETPALAGPDEVHRAPVLTFATGGVELDGDALPDAVRLGERLRNLRDIYERIRPGEPFSGELDVLCTPAAAVSSMREWLRAAALSDFEHVIFLFIHHERLIRPLLGPIDRVYGTAARADLRVTYEGMEAAPAGADVMDMSTQSTCAELSARMVEQRRRGRQVILDLGRVREAY